jgi:hypothetical protein
MQSTYRAILRNDRVEWIDPPPNREQPTPVRITLMEEAAKASSNQGAAMAEALEALVASGGVTSIPNASAWQKDIRRDRSLPARES